MSPKRQPSVLNCRLPKAKQHLCGYKESQGADITTKQPSMYPSN